MNNKLIFKIYLNKMIYKAKNNYKEKNAVQ